MNIAFADYSQVMRFGTSAHTPELLATRTAEEMTRLLAWIDARDPKNQAFTVLEEDGYPMPDSVQRLYGWRYLRALNAFRRLVEQRQAVLALEVALDA